MPRRSQRVQRNQNNTSNEDDEGLNDDDEGLNDDVNKCVRYFIYRSGSNEPIKKSELKKNVLTNVGRNFDAIVKKAGNILDEVYGFKLLACDDNGYITVQNLDIDDNKVNDDEVPGDIKKVLVMLVLANVFMSTNPVNEASMYTFLNTLGVDVDYDKGIFGKVKEFINLTMVKQNYIVLHTDPVSKEITYTWGARAERTISKHKILNFVSKVYGGKQPSSWESRYKDANQQFDGSKK